MFQTAVQLNLHTEVTPPYHQPALLGSLRSTSWNPTKTQSPRALFHAKTLHGFLATVCVEWNHRAVVESSGNYPLLL